MTDEWPLVGRGAEIDRVGELLADDHRHGVVLVGAPGVGKSRIGLEATALAARAGFATVRALASVSAAGLPLAAFAPLLPAGFADGDPADLLQRAQAGLLEAAAGRPLFALIDDGHHLDPVSASLTRQLVATGAAFVVVTLREGEQPPDAITAMWKDDLVDRIDVRPLDDDEVGQLLRAVLGQDVDPSLTAALVTRSGGNVLFLRELLAHGLTSGAIAVRDGIYRASRPIAAGERLTELIEGRLGDLSDAQRRLAELVALGEPLTLELLGGLGDLGDVEQLERARLVTTAVDGRDTVVRLSHPMYGEILRAGLTGVRQATLTGQLVDAHAAAGLDGAAPLKIAMWSLAAGRSTSSALLLQAAREAHALCDATLTERLAELALREDGGFEAAWLIGEAYAMSGRAGQAERTWAQLTESALDDGQRVRLSTHRFLNLVVALGDSDAAMAMLTEQTRLVTSEEARIAMTAPALGVFGVTGHWQAVREHYPAVAPKLAGLPRFIADLTYAMALVMGGATEQALALIDERDGQHGDVSGAGFLRFAFAHARAEALLYKGDLAAAQAQAEDVYARAVAGSELRTQVWLAAVQAKVALARGRPRTALRWARLAASTGRQLGQGPAVGDEQTLIVRAAALLGRLEEAETALHRYEAGPLPGNTYRATLLVAQADVAAAQGSTELARERLAQAAEVVRGDGDAVLELLVLHDAVRLGGAADVAPRLAELAGVVDGELAQLRVAHAAAVAAWDGTQLDAASGGFADAGAILLAAEAAADAAVAWHRHGDARRARAASLRAGVLGEQCEGARTAALAATAVRATLTPSQRRVAALAANGRSNKEIAAELVLSVRTVENMLARVYASLGIRSRGELADALRMD